MRAQLLGRFYQGLQAASALYVLATLAGSLGDESEPAPPARLPAAPVAAASEPAAPPAPEVVAAAPEPAPVPAQEPARPKAAIGVTIPEGQFDFEPASAATAALGKMGADAFPFVPPDPEPAPPHTGPPLIYRRGRFSGPLRVIRNPWQDPANAAFNQRGDAGRARAFAFDDRPEPPRGAGAVDPTTLVRSWKQDVAQYRALRKEGQSEEQLQHRLGDRYSSVRWAASLDELPPPTDSYAAALAREQKAARR